MSFVWSNPNEAAVILVCVSAAIWPILDIIWTDRFRITKWVSEIALIAAIAMTGSRAGEFAYMLSLLGYYALLRRLKVCSVGRSAGVVGFRVAVLAVAVLAYGAAARLRPSYFLHDNSILNRIYLWYDGLNCLFDFPSGVGVGNSGFVIRNWYQSESETTAWAHVMNTPLQVGIEHGVVILAILAWLVLCLIMIPYTLPSPTEERASNTGAGSTKQRVLCSISHTGLLSAIIAISFAGYTRSIWVECLIIGLIAAGLAGISRPDSRAAVFRAMFYALICVLVIVAACYTLKMASENREIRVFEDQSLTVARSTKSSSNFTIGLVVDRDVLGDLPGKAIRRALRELGESAPVCTVAPRGSERSLTTISHVLIVCGGGGSVEVPSCSHLVLLCPTFPPEDLKCNKLDHIFLGARDQEGFNAHWAEWASSHDVAVDYLADCGNNVSSKLSAVLRAVAEDYRSTAGNL